MPSFNFNYPSIGITNITDKLSVYRSVTYIGKGPTVYYLKLEAIAGVKASIYADVLRFSKPGNKITYRIDFLPYKNSNGSFEFGSLTWRNDVYMLRSLIILLLIWFESYIFDQYVVDKLNKIRLHKTSNTCTSVVFKRN